MYILFGGRVISLKYIATMALIKGMELGEDVTTYKNDLILKEGVIIDELSIAKLERYSIMKVLIKEPKDYATTRFEKMHLDTDYKKFEDEYKNNLNAYKYMIDEFIEKKEPINTKYLLQIHDNISKHAKSGEQLLDMLYNMIPSEDDLTYAHCLNASLISSVFGKWLSLSEEDIVILTLCGFFYDIGKITLPNSLIWSPGKLSDFQYNWMKTHTTIGYDLIKNQKLNQHIINATLMHHERCDGSGYPEHRKDEEIDIFAKYISIVDAYTAMTSARIYRKSKHAFEVIESFFDAGLEKYGAGIIRPILEHIADSQLGRKVRLSNNMEADIILINKNALARPLVKIGDEVLDLSKQTGIQIVSVI